MQDVYTELKSRVVGFDLRPGERLNEGALAKALGVSRTPVREALNRLVSEHLVAFQPGQGFFCRSLDPKDIFDLYELRNIIEVRAIGLAVDRATDAQIADLRDQVLGMADQPLGKTIAEAAAQDEAFHLAIARLTGNTALLGSLERINDRIRFIRWVRLASTATDIRGDHRRMIDALAARDADVAQRIMSDHIESRMDQVVEAVRNGISSLYLDGPEVIRERAMDRAS